MGKVIIVGGGAAGMLAAVSAAECGHQVTILEKNEKLGKKLFLTGKGRCNITNDSDVEGLLQHVKRNASFLYSAFYTFDSRMMMALLEQAGLRLKTERGGRVFPASDKSSDVIRTLGRLLKDKGVRVMLHTEVTGLVWQGLICTGVRTRNGILEGDGVIVATGGLSYPSTGSTGDGYRFARETGHRLLPAFPSLVPFDVEEEAVKSLQGLSLKNVALVIKKGKKVLYQDTGELLFTHFGISGPLVLSASAQLSGMEDLSGLAASIDLKPALSKEQLDRRIVRDFGECKNSYFKNSLAKLLPGKLIPVMVGLSGIPPEKQVNAVTREERGRLIGLFKGFPLTLRGLRGFDEAIITRGGVSVKDVNPGTMESLLVRGLYFAGEVLDLDALTGGYNLQIAWSTAWLAGKMAGNEE